MHDGRSSIVNLSRTKVGEFAITGVEVSHPEVFKRRRHVSTAAASRQAVRVRVAEGLDRNQMAERIKGSIRIHTDDAELGVVEVSVIVAPTRALAVRRPVPTVTTEATTRPHDSLTRGFTGAEEMNCHYAESSTISVSVGARPTATSPTRSSWRWRTTIYRFGRCSPQCAPGLRIPSVRPR